MTKNSSYFHTTLTSPHHITYTNDYGTKKHSHIYLKLQLGSTNVTEKNNGMLMMYCVYGRKI